MRQNQLHFFAYILLAIAGTYFIGMRGTDVGSDTIIYWKYFDYIKHEESFAGAERIEIGFYWLTKLIAYFTNSPTVYLSIIFLIQFLGITSALFKKSEILKPYLFVALVWLSYPFFYSITLNVIRQGLAFIFVVYSIDAKLQKKTFSPYVLLALGCLFHYATLLYVLCFLVLQLKPKFTTLGLIWLVAVFFAYFNWTEGIAYSTLGLIAGDSAYYSSYLDSTINEEYVTGFKLNFVMFSAMPIAYYFFLKRYDYKNIDGVEFIIKLYLVMNIIYLLLASFPYSDRVALASWLLIPLMVDFNFLRRVKMLRLFKELVVCLSVLIFSYHIFYTS